MQIDQNGDVDTHSPQSGVDIMAIAREQILTPAELNENMIEHVLGGMLGHALDAADIYLQHSRGEAWSLEDGIVKAGGYSIDRGVGIRAMSAEKTGFAYADVIDRPALEGAAKAARNIARSGASGQLQTWRGTKGAVYYPAVDALGTMPAGDKIAMLRRLDQEIRLLDTRIHQVFLSLHAEYEAILIMASDGTLAADARPMVQLRISVIAGDEDRRERGSAGGGGRGGYMDVLPFETALELGQEAVRQAVLNLEAKDAPAGIMPVVLGPGWPGVLLHEAVGHGLEGDFNRKGSSVYSGRVGEKVASRLCTVVDDGTMPGRRGSLNIDDEGTPTRYNVLIENGVLAGYMQDKFNARLMRAESTGNGRRESYAHPTLPRMTNTYMLPGEHDREELIASVDRGLYAANFGGGSVDITSGQFVFSATEAYLIEKGRITAPVKGVTLIGNGPEIMNHVSMVGNDLELDKGVGVCGKEGQSVPVGVGQPSLKIDRLTVGGVNVKQAS